MPILEVKNLTHTYGGDSFFITDAVKNVNFSIEKGEIVGIIGHTLITEKIRTKGER